MPANEPVAREEWPAVEAARWSFINDWHVNPQPNDRPLLGGAAAGSAGTPSARRASARQSHQAKFKKWSQSRHD